MGELTLLGLVSSTFSLFSVLASKASFALTLLRLVDGRWRKLLWAVIVSMAALIGPQIILTWMVCNPLHKLWHPEVEGRCRSPHFNNVFGQVSAGMAARRQAPSRRCLGSNWEMMLMNYDVVYSGGMDVFLALLPWKILWSLPMTTREKAGVAIAVSMGIL